MRARFRKSVTVTRQAAGAYVDGVWTPGGDATLTIQASVQPSSDQDMQRLPEGRRITGAVTLYTNDTLKLALGDQQADRIALASGTYEVEVSENWGNGLIPHNKYVCARIV